MPPVTRIRPLLPRHEHPPTAPSHARPPSHHTLPPVTRSSFGHPKACFHLTLEGSKQHRSRLTRSGVLSGFVSRTMSTAAAEICAVCQDDLGTDSRANPLFRLKCFHMFHEACVADHLRAHAGPQALLNGPEMQTLPCPTCRLTGQSADAAEASLTTAPVFRVDPRGRRPPARGNRYRCAITKVQDFLFGAAIALAVQARIVHGGTRWGRLREWESLDGLDGSRAC